MGTGATGTALTFLVVVGIVWAALLFVWVGA